TTTGFPLKSARLAGFPSASVKPACGAGCGGFAGINSPGLIFSSAAAAAAESTKRSMSTAVPNHADAPANPQADPPANPMWGGRFAGGPAAIMRRINASVDFDKRLYAEDIAGSLAHCAMLVAQHILTPEDGAAIAEGLGQIRAEI